jgi:hypothetical protein
MMKLPLGGISFFSFYPSSPVGGLSLSIVVQYLMQRPVGLIVVLKGQTTLPWWSYIVALLSGAIVAVGVLRCLLMLQQLTKPLSLSPLSCLHAWVMASLQTSCSK